MNFLGWEHLGGSASQNATQSGTNNFQQGIQSNQAGSNRLSMGKNTSDTFKAFQKAAQEKEQRERTLKEQNDLARQKKEQAERERKRMEHEKRKEREEEEMLEQARRAMMMHTNKDSVSNANSTPDTIVTNKVPIGPPSGGSLQGGHDSPVNDDSSADRARQQREQLRREEQERRRREANANRIDMNRQSDLMAAFEENII